MASKRFGHRLGSKSRKRRLNQIDLKKHQHRATRAERHTVRFLLTNIAQSHDPTNEDLFTFRDRATN